MFRNTYNGGLMTVFFACGSNPLRIWDVHCSNGSVTKFLDQDIKSIVVEISGVNVSTTYIVCPKGKTVLGISLPFLVMVVKNLKKYFSFEVTILDHTKLRRRFRVSNFQSTTQVNPFCTFMPIGLSDGWNQIQFNLAEFTRRAYKTHYLEVHTLKINCSIRLRRVYFAERLMTDEELPAEFKLFFPLASKVGKPRKSTETKERQIIPDQRKSSKLGIALAESVHSYKMSQEKMAATVQEGRQSNQAEVRTVSTQVLDKEILEAGEAATGVVPVQGGDELLQLHLAQDAESATNKVAVEVPEGAIPTETTEEEMAAEPEESTKDETTDESQPLEVSAAQSKDSEVTEGEIPAGATEEKMITEAVEGKTFENADVGQPLDRAGSSIAKETSVIAAASGEEFDSNEQGSLRTASVKRMSTIPEENTVTETHPKTPPSE